VKQERDGDRERERERETSGIAPTDRLMFNASRYNHIYIGAESGRIVREGI
jgi:hypothetical protein